MPPKVSGPGSAGTQPGPGGLAAVAAAPPPATNPAPEPSAVPEPASAQAPATGQRAGSGSAAVSGPPAGARRASVTGSEAGTQRASAFSAVQENAQSVPDNSDASRTRFIFQGPPFGPRASGLGTGKATSILQTPAAYIGQRPGVSGPERAAFIRKLEEVLCPDLRPPVQKITQEEVKVMLSLLEEILHLRQQVSLRDDLLQLYSDSDEEDDEDEEEEEEERDEEEEQRPEHPCEASELTPVMESESHHCPQQEALQEQLRLLEEENEQLREEVSQLDDLEEEEQIFILDCVEQFSEASQQMAELSEVLALRMENYEQQWKEVAQLRVQVVKLQRCCWWYGAETEKLQKQLASEKEIQMKLQGEEALPDFQETLAEELRMSIRRIISDPVFFVERNYEVTPEETSDLGYEPRYGEERAQEQGLEAGEGLMSAEDFVPAEELVPEEEELGPTEEAAPAEEGVIEEAELMSEEAEAWEDLELEVDEATQMNMVTSALEASGLGPSHLDIKYVLQQLANCQDAHFRQQLRQKMIQKGFAVPQQSAEAP
ncbi:huntingtin-associated protein 1 isoform X3 [Odocoileus virginianus]|uniref:Huntingtin-associated protein 1 isoform X3 n=1 Tax=Odocoileus virginianus TaxID=9874 RepID=A0ABM4J6A8_ODOVR